MIKINSFILLMITFMLNLTSLTHGQEPYRGSDAFIRSEFIFSAGSVPFPSCHASTLTETKNGLIAAWFGGTKEKSKDVSIWVSRYEHNHWTIPREVANGKQSVNKRYPTWNPVLFNMGSRVSLFYKVGPSPRSWWGEAMYSTDNGSTWSSPSQLPEGILGPIKDKPVFLNNGWILSPSSTEDQGWQVHMEISKDTGKTWSSTGALNNPGKAGLIQPTILVHPDGKIQTLCRSKNGWIYTSWSEDNGLTWGPFTATGLPNPNSGIDAVTLRNGTFLLVYNHISPQQGKAWGDRNILNVAVSDDGLHWKAAVLLENDPDKDAEYSYPAVIQTKDGMIHVTYTWNRKLIKHVIIDPSRIKPRDFLHGTWPEE